MAELKEEDLAPGELTEADLAAPEEGMPRKPDETDAEYTARTHSAPTPEEKGVLGKVAEFLDPKTATGAFATGVSKGAPLGFGDELYGALAGAADVHEQNRKRDEDVEQAKKSGTYDPSAAAPAIPGVTSYMLKRPGMEDRSVVRGTGSTGGPLPMSGGRTAEVGKFSRPGDELVETGPDIKKAYQQARDAMREQYAVAEHGAKDQTTGKRSGGHPGAFLGGDVFGSFAVPVPGVGKAKGLAKAGRYAGLGAGLGFLGGLGNSEADLTEGDVGNAAIDTAIGTAGGAVTGGLLGGGAAKLDPWLEQKAARSAFKALDPYMASIAKELGPDATKGEILAEAQRLGGRVLDEGIIPHTDTGVPFDVTAPTRFQNSEQLAERALGKANEAGVLKGATVDVAQDALTKAGAPTPVSLGRLATNIEQEAEAAKLAGNQKLARKLMKEATDIRQTIVDRSAAGFTDPAAQTLQEAEKFKTGLQGQVDYGKPLASRTAQTAVARLAKEQAEKAIESGLGPEDLEQFKAVKDRFADLKSISNIANHGAVRGFRNNAVGLGDKLAAEVGASAAAGGPAAIPAAVAAGAAHHFANHRGQAGLARTLSNAAKSTSPALAPLIERWSTPSPDEEENPPPWHTLGGH